MWTGEGRRLLWEASQTRVAGPTQARLSKHDALDAVAALGVAGTADASVRLVWARTPVGLRLSWIVDPPPDLVALHNHVFRVDASTGAVQRVADNLTHASAQAYPENPVKTPKLELFELSGLVDPGETLTHPWFDVQSCFELNAVGSCNVMRLAAPDEAGDFLGYEPQSGFVLDDAFAEASAYVHAERFWTRMQSFGLTTTFCEDVFEDRMVVATNFFLEGPEPYDNGFYTGRCPVNVVLGQGPRDDWAYDGDLVYHELGHAVVHERVPTYIGRAKARPEAWTYDSRAINEAVADALSTAMTGDSIVAESLFSRDIDTEEACPGRLSGQPHNDSLPVSGALWTLQQAWGEAFTPVLLDALTALPQDVGYEEFAEAMSSVAGMSLGADAEAAARAEFEARGLFDCERTVELEPGAGTRFVLLGSELGLNPYTPPPVQFAIEVPAGTVRVELDYLSADELLEMPTAAHVAWRWGEPVLFEYGGPSGGDITTTFDDGASDLPVGGTLEFESVVSNEPTRLYLAFVNPDEGRHWVGVENLRFVEEPSAGETGGGESSTGEPGSSGGVDAESSGAGPDELPEGTGESSGNEATAVSGEDGCSCRADGQSGFRGVLLLLLLGAVRRRRLSPV